MNILMNNRILSVSDIYNRDINLKSLINKRILIADDIYSLKNIIKIYENNTDSRYCYTFKGILENKIISVNEKTFQKDKSKYIYLLENYYSYIPFNLDIESNREYLLGKTIKINKSDDFSMRYLLNNKEPVYIENINGFYQDKKKRWFAVTSNFKIESTFLVECQFFDSVSPDYGTPIAAIAIRSFLNN